MSQSLIVVEKVGKKYRIRHQQEGRRYVALRDVITEKFGSLFRSRRSSLATHHSTEDFWALKDISFEIKQGEVVGIIGRNGAGKSTLLKILSRITKPTEGRALIRGRVASLLEVGTGFHPEMTGRENIFLNGAILGMTRVEMKRKFDEIVSFAEVEKFLDTPMKHYSSGMYLRLAFAVSAHLEPEILVVDEVLAVGDAEFQKKCLGKMSEVSMKEGRTVLFVSHNMEAIRQLCSRCLVLDQGLLVADCSDTKQAIQNYLHDQAHDAIISEWRNNTNAYENPSFQPQGFRLCDSSGTTLTGTVPNSSQVWVEIFGTIREVDPSLCVGFSLFTSSGQLLLHSFQTDVAVEQWPKLNVGPNMLRAPLPNRILNGDLYRLELAVGLHFREWLVQPGRNSPSIFVRIDGDYSDSPYWRGRRESTIVPVLRWTQTEGGETPGTNSFDVSHLEKPFRATS